MIDIILIGTLRRPYSKYSMRLFDETQIILLFSKVAITMHDMSDLRLRDKITFTENFPALRFDDEIIDVILVSLKLVLLTTRSQIRVYRKQALDLGRIG
jgi:hypothetical protein